MWVIFREQSFSSLNHTAQDFIVFKFLVPCFWYVLRKMLCLFSETLPSFYTTHKLKKEFSIVIGKRYTVPLLSPCLLPQIKLCLNNITVIN